MAVLLAIALAQGIFSQDAAPSADGDSLLIEILKNTRAYCHKLDNFAFEFRCREEVTEDLPSKPKARLVMPSLSQPGSAPTRSVTKSETRNTYIYIYHLIRQQRISHEKRTLREMNRQPLLLPNAALQAVRFHFDNLTFGPIDIFGEVGRLRHEYRIAGRETFKGEKAIIVEAVPNVQTIDYNPGAKAWVREGDSAVLKIEWDPVTWPEYIEIKAAAEASNITPVVTLVTEYGVEKDGIRFPSRFFVREAYLRAENGKAEVASEVTIDYEDYEFIRIESDPVKDDEEGS
jgi:hypothetical protein